MVDMIDRCPNFGLFVITADEVDDIPPFTNDNGVVIKYHNRFLDFDYFQNFLMKFVRGTEYFDFVMDLGEMNLRKGEEVLNLLTIIIKEQQYTPFAFD